MAESTAVALATGMSPPSIQRPRRVDRTQPGVPLGRPEFGAGRKPLVERDPRIIEERDRSSIRTRGRSDVPLRWTCKSPSVGPPAQGGHPVSHDWWGKLLASLGYSLRANVKTKEGRPSDRGCSFSATSNERVREGWRANARDHVDTNKTELIG